MRVPCAVRWPGKIPAGKVANGIVAHNDWMPTLLAAAGEPDIKQKLLKGHNAAGERFKVHLDGYNMLDYLRGGAEGMGPRDRIVPDSSRRAFGTPRRCACSSSPAGRSPCPA